LIDISALPSAAAQAAAVTAMTRAVLLQGLLPLQRMPIRFVSSVVTVDAAGWLDIPTAGIWPEMLVPSTRAASALATRPVCAGNVEALNVTPGNICAASDGVLTMTLQYWIASCAVPTWLAAENASRVGTEGSCCCTL
jgi:hypothetical protein